MSQIFLSYSSNDRDRVLPLVRALQEDGYTVWWDREIRPGPSFDREIEREIGEAGCIVVVWSESSVDSEWVRAEVEEGARRGLLVPVLIDEVLPPLAHRRRQAANLTDWDGDREGEYAKLIAGIEATLSGEQSVVETTEPVPTRGSHVASPPRRRRRGPGWPALVVTALVALVVGAGISLVFLKPRPKPQPQPREARFEIQLPQGLSLTSGVAHPVMITPNGNTVVFNATDISGKTGTRYYTRPLDKLSPTVIDGVESHQLTGLGSLWRGPQDEWFIYNDPIASVYKKERISGGTPIPIASTNLESTGILGLDWGPNGDIVFANTANPSLMLLKGGAGTATPLTHPPDSMFDEDPHFTPDGKAVVYDETKKDKTGPHADRSKHVMVLELATGKTHNLLEGEQPRITTTGHLLFVRNNILWATAFDEKQYSVYGKQVPILEGLLPDITSWDLADNGTLVYVPNSTGDSGDTRMMWLSADGATESIPSFQHSVVAPALSPDDSRLAITSFRDTGGQASIWVYAFDKQIASRLTFNKDVAAMPAWSPDGKWIAYVEGGSGSSFRLMLRSADGTGEPRRLAKGVPAVAPAFTPDGRSIIFDSCDKVCAIAKVDVSGKTPVSMVLKSSFNQGPAEVSPDGRWIAYASQESGQSEVFVRPWPDVDRGRWQVSNNGGDVPAWSPDSGTLYYVEPISNGLMSVAIGSGKVFSAGKPKRVANFGGYDWKNRGRGRNFCITRDGKRFLMIKSTPNNKIVVVLNWLNEVERLVPTSGAAQ